MNKDYRDGLAVGMLLGQGTALLILALVYYGILGL